MAKLLPILLMLGFGLVMWKISAWSTGRSLRRNSRPLHNDQIDALLHRLAASAGVEKIAVRMLDAAMINGLATPQGEIYVTRGLVKQLQAGRITAAEFASVIAHELGHLALGHTKRRMVDVAGAQAATYLIGGLLARFIPYIGWYIARWLSSFFIATLSRKDEFEADAYATALMIRSGLGAEPQAQMLEKLEELIPAAAMAKTSWLASHPAVRERTKVIRENAARWQAEDDVKAGR